MYLVATDVSEMLIFVSRSTLHLSGPRLCFTIIFHRELGVYRDGLLTNKRVIMRTDRLIKCLNHFRN